MSHRSRSPVVIACALLASGAIVATNAPAQVGAQPLLGRAARAGDARVEQPEPPGF